MSPSAIACVFPGQGSQRRGMGADLLDRHGSLCDLADAVLGYSIRELCLADPRRQLRQTAYTQPALFVVNALTWLDRQDGKRPPAFLAGHSLGEYNALHAAGCFDFETGLRLVQRRGALMAEARDGGMAAVLGLDAERVRKILQECSTTVEIANVNLPTQLVLSGPKSELEALVEPMEQGGARKCLLLNVSGAFHSRYMAPSAAEFELFLRDFTFAAPSIPVISNVTAQPHPDDTVAALLVEQIRSPVRWSDTLAYLREQGVDEIEELGPGNVLGKLWTAFRESSPAPAQPAARAKPATGPAVLGDAAFRRDYGLRYAYVAGSPTPGIRNAELVSRLGEAGLLGFLDTFDLSPDAGRRDLAEVKRRLGPGGPFGVSLRPASDERTVTVALENVALENGVRFAEADGYDAVTPALVRFRFQGAHRDASGKPVAPRQLLALVSRSAVAELFLRPAPPDVVAALVADGRLTADEAEIAALLPLSSDVCAVAGTADGDDLATLLPTVQRLRDRLSAHDADAKRIRVGAGGAIGTPEAVACAFLLGADFVQTRSLSMACIESGTSTAVKELLAELSDDDTVSVPAADGFSLGARVQVVRKGSFFAPRAQKLYELFRFYDSFEAIDPGQRETLEKTWFKRSFDAIRESLNVEPTADGKQQMAAVFTWYLRQSLRWAIEGQVDEKLSFQVPCDASMAAFNAYAAGTELAVASNRSVVAVAERLMADAYSFMLDVSSRFPSPRQRVRRP